ncbi:GyrI-like domain-containing protein [Flaviramulus sp. BrNp1-15]|uniref:GyrI-like domain-containing protein n=1 Tax=Flaviramulus sp. BrNp1-15 TaxID=2916754 RepID=UPI001EE84134|nr:GyrI-like domain-containing protein [Flaviramulus sp. BrNp1-15]ULC58654.1 GyrI-like domain-containing protein [Flaviramulus sp. BrNp1-15]
MQKPRVESITTKKLIGQSIEMSLTNNKTFDLFSGFMPKRKLINNIIGEAVYEVCIYDDLHFKSFNPNNTFSKWATIEVSNFENLPEGMKALTINEGLYAIFKYKGLAKDFGSFMSYIFSEWFPKSEYILDNRPHFNVLGEQYKNNHPDSEEDVYIPIKLKA